MSECIYPCGWKKLKSILIKESSFFAIETLDDSVSDGVRKCGISLGNRARDLADYAETQQQRIKELEQQLKTARKEAFIAGVIKGNPSAEGRSTVDEAAEEYANNLEGE
tara:strand:- start:4314 stop:4640 length:327 start_codon:yes stop_codon:yes gene_type:complete